MARGGEAWLAALALAACGRSGFGDPPRDASADTSTDAAIDAFREPVTLDSVSPELALCTSSPCTVMHTVGDGTDPLIVIWYFCADNATAASSVTCDGVQATHAGAGGTSGITFLGELLYAPASASATHTISVTHSCAHAYVAAVSAFHVDPGRPVRNALFLKLDGTLSIGGTIDSASGDLVLDGVCHGDSILGPTPPQQQLYGENITMQYACGSFAGSTQPGAAPSVQSQWTSAIMDHWILMGLSLRPVGAP